MKKIVSIALVFVFAFAAFSVAKAQDNNNSQENKPVEEKPKERKITEAEFKAVQKKSADLTKGKSYRLRKSSKTYKKQDNSLMYYFDETAEYMMPDNSRSVVENGSSDGSKTITETVRIGQTVYSRINNGAWQTNQTKTADRTQNTSYDSTEHTYKGRAELNGAETDLYESKYVSKTMKGGRDFVTTIIVKNWFDKNGVLLKTEEQIETPNSNTQKTFEYEYDENISIQAPIN